MSKFRPCPREDKRAYENEVSRQACVWCHWALSIDVERTTKEGGVGSEGGAGSEGGVGS